MKIRKLVDSFNYAINGLIHAFLTERNMKIHFVIVILTLIAAIVTKVSRLETIILFITITLVVVAEMINTSIETVVDMISKEFNPLAAIAKNVAAGAVLITAINAVAVGYLVFYDKISELSQLAINQINVIPVHGTAISIALILFIVIVIKAVSKSGKFMKGGMPSGHSALAASLSTSICLVSGNPLIAGLAALLAFIVLHSRIDAGIHTLYEVLVGAILGVLITILIFQLFWL